MTDLSTIRLETPPPSQMKEWVKLGAALSALALLTLFVLVAFPLFLLTFVQVSIRGVSTLIKYLRQRNISKRSPKK